VGQTSPRVLELKELAMTATCAIAAFAFYTSLSISADGVIAMSDSAVRPDTPVCLAAGDALCMQLMEAVPADLPAHSTRLAQATQSDGWWSMPAGTTVVANSNSR